MQCDGKCHLKSIIEDISPNSENLPFSEALKELSISLFLTPQSTVQSSFSESFKSIRIPDNSETENRGYLSSIFHPPRQVA